MTSCTFTGHRPAGFAFGDNERSPGCRRFKEVLAQQIERVCGMGVTVFNTGCALGTDMWAAEEVVKLRAAHPELGLELHSFIPFEGQDSKWSFTDRRRYRRLRAASDRESVISASYSNQAYFERNRRMVDAADIVIAVFDCGERRRSGTLQTVNYAKSRAKPIIFINPTDFSVTEYMGGMKAGIV